VIGFFKIGSRELFLILLICILINWNYRSEAPAPGMIFFF
jgi:hypothetical protein